MLQKFGFTLKQAVFNVKRSMMTIITLALAISMIAGLFYYFDAFEREALRSSSQFEGFTDLSLQHSSTIQQLNTSENFLLTNEGVYNALNNAELELETSYKYQSISATSSFTVILYKNHSDPLLLAAGLNDRELFRLNSFQFDNNFYESERFTSFFKIMEGRTPQNKSEILIDFVVAAKLDVTVGSTVDLNTEYTKSPVYDTAWVNIPNMTIVGTFIPTTKLPNYQLIDESYSFQNYYAEFTDEEIDELEYIDMYDVPTTIDRAPVLGYSTFETNDHPFQQFYRDLEAEVNSTITNFYYSSGYGVTLDREFTSFFNLYPPDRTVQLGVEDLDRTLPGEIIIRDLITEPLQELFEKANRLRIISQVINLPILVVALVVGSFASKSSAQNKVDEFLLLRSKGVSKSMVRNQILMEAVANGLVASILGIGIGFLTFYGHDIWIRPLIYTQFIEIEISLFVKQTSILLSLGIGIIVSMITSFTSMVYVSKLKTSELLMAIEQKEMEIGFDEQTVYTSLGRSSKEIRKKRREHKKEYKDIIEEKRKKIKKRAFTFILIGFLPLYYFIFIKFGGIIFTRQWFLRWEDYSSSFSVYAFLSLLFAISPIFFVIALVRIITIEAPVLFARISRFLGKIFLKDKSYLLGLQMMKKKQYATVIMLLSIFSAIFVHLNITTYSLNAQKYVYHNYETGADLFVNFGYGINMTNTGEFRDLTDYMKSIEYQDEQLVEDAMVVYRLRHILRYYLHYVNFSSYLNYVVEDSKILPDRNFISSIMDLLDYNLNHPERDIYPGAIVNQKYLENNNAEVGDIVIFPYKYYDTTLPIDLAYRQSYDFEVRIVGIVDYMPGVYTMPLNPDSIIGEVTLENIVVDVRDLPMQSDIILHSTNTHLLVNLNEKVKLDKDSMEDLLIASTEDHYGGISRGDYIFYNKEWTTLQDYDVVITNTASNYVTPLLIYKMAYLIFIVVLIQVALGLPILLTSVRRKEYHFYGILMSRGFGKKGIFRFMVAEIFVIYFLALFGSIAVGFLSATLTLLIGNVTNPYSIGHQFRLFLNPMDLLTILGSVVGVSFLILLIGFLSTTRRSISEYLTKF